MGLGIQGSWTNMILDVSPAVRSFQNEQNRGLCRAGPRRDQELRTPQPTRQLLSFAIFFQPNKTIASQGGNSRSFELLINGTFHPALSPIFHT